MTSRIQTLAASSVRPGPAPETLSRRINAERLVLLGWTRAILLQLAHPLVAAGVADHSGFRASPFAAVSRLHHTVRAMLALTFGNDEERERALEGIRTIHRRVNGRLGFPVGCFPEGTPYSAEDPSLVRWVHATLVDSVPLVFHLLVHPLTDADRDLYCREAAPIAIALGARANEVPQNATDLRRYLDGMYASGAIAVGPNARDLCRAVMNPPGTRLIAPAAWINHLLTAGLLPEPIREAYGFPWNPRRERQLSWVLAALRTGRRLTPGVLATWRDARSGAR